MKRAIWIAVGIFLLVSGRTLWAGDFQLYPGAKLDEKLTKEAIEMTAGVPGGDAWAISIYTTKDSFEKVVEFYGRIGNRYHMPSGPESISLPSGTEIKSTYFLFGGAVDLPSAKSWIKVQNPLMGHSSVMMLGPETRDEDLGIVKGVTTIMHMKKN